MPKFLFIFLYLLISITNITAQQNKSPVGLWIDILLEGIRNEDGRPTIHARNIFHTSIALYDTWAFYDKKSETYLLGKTRNGVETKFKDPPTFVGLNLDSCREISLHYAAYSFLRNRFNQYSSKTRILEYFDDQFDSLGLDKGFNSIDYSNDSPAALGNFIAQCVINYGSADGSNEEDQHESIYYEPSNPPLMPNRAGTKIINPNRWQPLSIKEYVLEKGFDRDLKEWSQNLIPENQDIFLTPEWGNVLPFSLDISQAKIFTREAEKYTVYNDPGPPPFIDLSLNYSDSLSDEYKWGFLLVALWSSMHDPSDSVKIDISPGAKGKAIDLPIHYKNYKRFYKLLDGGSYTIPYKRNPYTNLPYEPNIVYRGDYSRVISEYWVDGIHTYTPPGHWVKLLSEISYHPEFSRKWKGKGKKLTQLEWDIKSFFVLGGAVHDAAICAWGVKGWYDYVRPISAIRLMAQKGQCSNPDKANYNPHGLPLIDRKIELVNKKDSLAGNNGENIGKIKIMAWRGPDYIIDSHKDKAGVGWILAENWWPYQRYSAATPPFAGYIAGHSTFSITSADVLTIITGNAYFPGGLLEYTAKKNDFLIFENGPSKDITLQWATYREAAEETCLSRIWGGIHPPADDIKGRAIGEKVAKSAVYFANQLFE